MTCSMDTPLVVVFEAFNVRNIFQIGNEVWCWGESALAWHLWEELNGIIAGPTAVNAIASAFIRRTP